MHNQDREALRKELWAIQDLLSQPFKAIEHRIRDLKGKKLYIYVGWEAIRDRLAQVVPDYEVEFSHLSVDVAANLASVNCAIAICGVSRQAMGGVPVSEISSAGNEMTRGNSLDRAQAEAFKNAAEMWGVGAYLSDQYRAWKVLDADKARIPVDYRNKLNTLAVQLKTDLKNNELFSRYYLEKQAGDEPSLLSEAPKQSPAKIFLPKEKTTEVAAKTSVNETEFPYPQSRQLVGHAYQHFKYEGLDDYVSAFCKNFGAKSPGYLIKDQAIALTIGIASSWAMTCRFFSHQDKAEYDARTWISDSAGGVPANAVDCQRLLSLLVSWKEALLEISV